MTDAAVPRLDLKQILSGAQLPALPQSAIRLLELSQDPSNGPAEFAVPIESDPGLTGQVLRFVNSSYFGFSREISSVKLAITLVGIRTIKNFALWSAVFSLMPNPKCGPFDLKSLWQDSLRRALFARAVAKILGMKEAEEPFAAALLQDMAVPILAHAMQVDPTCLPEDLARATWEIIDHILTNSPPPKWLRYAANTPLGRAYERGASLDDSTAGDKIEVGTDGS